jgi:hypothetical protein
VAKMFRRGCAVAGVIAAAALVLGGCSSSSKAAGGSSSVNGGQATGSSAPADASGGGSNTVSADESLAAEYMKQQPDIAVTPLTSKPAADKTIAILSCPTPGCQVSMNAAAAGAKKLGWTVKYFTSQLTAEDYQATWTRIVQSNPDFVAYQAFFPNATISSQLSQLAQRNVATVSMVSSDPVSKVMRGVALGPADAGFNGKLLAAAVVADAKGAAKTVYVTDPTFIQWNNLQKNYVDGVTAAGGSVHVLDVSLQNQTAIAGQVTSYLQSNPGVKYAVFPDASSVMLGVPAALKAAGISGVKIASVSPQAADLVQLKSGEQWISIATEVATSGYRLVDMLARISEGMSFDATPVGWHQILTKSNITETSEVPPTPGSPQAFFTAWHVA